MFFLGKWLANFVVLAIVSLILGALVLTLAQLTIKPILTLLTLPINILTLGLFSLVINGLIIWLMASIFGAAIIAWILASQATDSLTKRLKTRIAHNKEGEPF